MEIKKVLITPIIANEYLKANTANRRINTPTLMRYVNEMLNGKWKTDTGEMIKISKTGVVLDGQHRLLSIVKSGVSLYFHIITGLDDKVFDVLDTGKNRNACDIFYIDGIKNANKIPSMIQLYEAIKNGQIDSQSIQKNSKHSNSSLLDLYYKKPIFWDEVASKSNSWYKSFAKILAPSTIGGFYALFYDISPYQAELFFDQLCTGLNLTNNSIGLLRVKLMQDKMSNTKMTTVYKNALIIKNWNNFRRNKEVKLVKFDPQVELFPVAI
jgi:hypothetical protein